MQTPPAVEHLQAESRFEIRIGTNVATLEYNIEGESINMHHTYVPPELRGRSIAGQLTQAAITYAEESGLRIIPTCSYIAKHLERYR